MDTLDFLQQFEEEVSEEHIIGVLYDELDEYRREHDIPEEEMSVDDLLEAAEFVTNNGFNY